MAVNIETDQRHIIKVLKPVRNNKIVREINIRKTLANGPNIIALTGVVKEQDTRDTCLIFGLVCNEDCQRPPEGMRPYRDLRGVDYWRLRAKTVYIGIEVLIRLGC